MCTQQQPTEIDRLLPSPVSDRRSYYQKNDDSTSRRRRYLLLGVAALALVFSIHAAIPFNKNQGIKKRSYKPKEQLGSLQLLTENALMLARPPPNNKEGTAESTKSHTSRHPKGHVHVLEDKKHSRNDNDSQVFHCTSQVMIMRHCDKEVKVIKAHGKTHTTDMRDQDGDRHCSAKGKERSEYIATLFVDPDSYQELVEDNGKEVADGIPPVPMIKSSRAKESKVAAKKKPQFPTPLKLYALSSERTVGKKPSKQHDNFREIETITPLSNKFHLDVDDRFGIEEEGELASDFFESLSTSVTNNVDMMMINGRDLSSDKENDNSELCNSGMTVVNWKHSRIPTLARALGCGTGEGCPKRYKGRDFDTVWLLTFQYSLLLDGGDDEELVNVDEEMLALESLSKSAEGGDSLRHHKKKRRHSNSGSWKITAELVNEGFEPV